jgi:hypothetical protein
MAAIDCTAAQPQYAIPLLTPQRNGRHVSHAVIAKCAARRWMQQFGGGRILKTNLENCH